MKRARRVAHYMEYERRSSRIFGLRRGALAACAVQAREATIVTREHKTTPPGLRHLPARALLLAGLALLAPVAPAAPLHVVNVSAPAVNCVYDPACRIVVNDSTGDVTLAGGGTGFFQSRTFTGKPGAPAAGLTGYEYRLDLRNAVAITGASCVSAVSLDFGPVVGTLDFNGDGHPDDAYVVTGGGLGSVGLASAVQAGHRITFTFSSPVCPGGHPGAGQSSFFFGLASTQPPQAVTATYQEPGFAPKNVAARAPSLAGAGAAEPLTILKDIRFRPPVGWTVVSAAYPNALALTKLRGERERVAHLSVTTETRRSHAEALQRLLEIAAESPAQASAQVAGGWPAVERQEVVELPRTELGDEEPAAGKVEKAHAVGVPRGIAVTVAVAVGDVLVRFEGLAFGERDEASVEEVRRAAETLMTASAADPHASVAEVEQLRKDIVARPRPESAAPSSPGVASPPPPATPSGPGVPSAAVQVRSGIGELEVAVSNGGQDVVIGANSGWARSHDGGGIFTSGGGTPGTFPRDGDPSLAVGQSGNFYYAFIGYPDGSAGAGGVSGCSDSVARSTDGGNTFPFLAHAVFCPFTAASLCFPDQEHIAADRWNAAAGNDQLYVTWRQFAPVGSPPNCQSITTGFVTPSIVCSQNGGTTWTAPAVIGTGDRPRVAVGRDGFVYVTYRSGGNIMLHKFSSCAAGLTPQVGFPVTVTAAAEVACPMAGLDRCNSFGSPTVAPDDLDANQLYLGYAVNTSASNDDVLVRRSTDSGANWSAPVKLNASVTGRRFMPWTCAVGGTVQAGWYDRRAATAAAVDLTDYYRGSAFVKTGALQAGAEVNVTGASDPQCASGWPSGVDSTGASELCNVQPQLGGRCRNAMNGGSNAACDFTSGPACAAGESCVAIGGAPKYGDYNGIACGFGRVYTAWASATPPAGTAATGSGLRIFSDASPVPSDFFVRDWTVDAASHDTGTEPSTHADFYDNSDVWIQATSAPVAFVNDQPPVDEVVQESTGAAGDNFLFARVSRRTPAAPGVPDAALTVRYLWADFGLGTNYALLGTAALAMHAADATVVPAAGFPWHVDPTTSTHVCIAAEIDGPGDFTASPPLAGLPAGGATDALVRLDNNKAQRNLGVSVTTGSPHAGSAFYALVHNGELRTRDIVVSYAASPGLLAGLRDARVQVLGQPRPSEPMALEKTGRVVLSGLRPGENRWLALTYAGVAAAAGEPMSVNFSEGAGDHATNGFVVRVKVVSPERLAYLGALALRRTYGRMAAAFALPRARKLQALAEVLLRKAKGGEYGQPRVIEREAYLAALGEAVPLMRDLHRDLLKARRANDSPGVGPALAALAAALPKRDFGAAAAAHAAALNRLDAWQTMLQKAEGDPADVLQNVRWQQALFERSDEAAGREIAKASAAFLRRFATQPLGATDYAALVRALSAPLRHALHGRGPLVDRRLDDLERRIAGPTAALQKAHRELLLALEG